MERNDAIIIQIAAYGRDAGMVTFHVQGPAASHMDKLAAEAVIRFDFDRPLDPLTIVNALQDGAPATVLHLQNLLSQYPNVPILLELLAEDVFSAPWEHVFAYPMFNIGSLPRRVFRHSPNPAKLSLVPLTMPIDVLLATFNSWPHQNEFPRALRHFRTVNAERVTADRLRSLLGSTSFDIVHIRTTVPENAPDNRLSLHEGLLPRSTLSRLLSSRKAKARLLILETDVPSLGPALETAHQVMGKAGPSVIVAPTTDFNFKDFYYSLIHNNELAWAFEANKLGNDCSLLVTRDGGAGLDLQQAANAIYARAKEEKGRVSEALANIKKIDAVAAVEAKDKLETSYRKLQEIESASFSYLQESTGLDPMTAITEELENAISTARPHETVMDRVVNVWFMRYGKLQREIGLGKGHTLASDTTYLVNVMVGPAAEQNIISRPRPLPETILTPHYREGDLLLRVILSSAEFSLTDNDMTLTLPTPPSASVPISFEVKTPRLLGPARIRVGVYFQNNLLQSIIINVVIAASEMPHTSGRLAEIEWVLSSSFKDLETYEPKGISILMNESAQGTHTLAVVGTDFVRSLDFDALAAHRMINEARGELQWVCGDPERKEEYKFEPDNRGTSDRFREQLASLAHFGYDLYQTILGEGDDEFEAELERALASRQVIQAVWMKSAKNVFPWALVYDYPLIFDPGNETCPDFQTSIISGSREFDSYPCFARGCQYRNDTNVVCPSGFWGFRHIIEQPLSSLPPAGKEASALLGSTLLDAIYRIPVNQTANLLIGYNGKLKSQSNHRSEISLLGSTNLQESPDRNVIGQALKRLDLNLVYFYCHGGLKHGQPWLGVGGEPPEYIYSTFLKAWGIKWPDIHPLVFINGCNTVGLSPDTLLTFNERFSRSRAAGVIGTEIAIPETLAADFGKRFIEGLLDGERVGYLIRRLRLELLVSFNPLGLAYTPYCLADLRFDRS